MRKTRPRPISPRFPHRLAVNIVNRLRGVPLLNRADFGLRGHADILGLGTALAHQKTMAMGFAHTRSPFRLWNVNSFCDVFILFRHVLNTIAP